LGLCLAEFCAAGFCWSGLCLAGFRPVDVCWFGLCPVGLCAADICWLEFGLVGLCLVDVCWLGLGPVEFWPVSLGRAVLCWARLCAVRLRFLLAGVYRLHRCWVAYGGRVLGGLPECQQLQSFGFRQHGHAVYWPLHVLADAGQQPGQVVGHPVDCGFVEQVWVVAQVDV